MRKRYLLVMGILLSIILYSCYSHQEEHERSTCANDSTQNANCINNACSSSKSNEKRSPNSYSQHDEYGHGHDEHEHDHSSNQSMSFAKLEKQKCEHGIFTLNCSDCRHSLGVVKIEPETAKRLITTEQVSPGTPVRTLQLVGEVQVNRRKTVAVYPIVSGRITKIVKKLGDRVEQGQLLALMHSRDYGQAKLDYISANRQYKIASENMQWTHRIHENLRKLLKSAQNSNTDLLKLINNLQIGKYKTQLIEVVAKYRLAQANYQREIKILHNTQRMVKLLKQNELRKIENQFTHLKIGEWKAKLLRAAAKWQLTKSNYRREKTLLTSDVSTKQTVQQAESEYRSAKSEYQATIESVAFWLQKRRLELKTELESAAAQYQSVVEELTIDLKLHKLEVEKEYQEASNNKAVAQRQLLLLGLTAKEIENIHLPQGNSFGTLEIRAPITGTVIAFDMSPGQFVEINHPLYTISNLAQLWIWCDLYQHHLARLQNYNGKLPELATKVRITTYPGKVFTATIDHIANIMDKRTRTVKMRVLLNNRSQIFKPGMFAEVDVIVPETQKIITVPREALYEDDKHTFLFKHWRDNFWIRVNVKLGRRSGERWIVKKGIKIGERIVTRGGFMLKSEIFKNKMGAG